jgi:DNA-binding CsgD family transcriptional regulator
MGNLYEMEAISPFRQPTAALRERLTPRQLDVLALLCEGLPNKLIGRRLNISSATVKIHVAHILQALNVSSRLQAVIAARSLGLEFKSGDAEAMRRETVNTTHYPAVLRLVPDDDARRLPVAASERSLAAVAG